LPCSPDEEVNVSSPSGSWLEKGFGITPVAASVPPTPRPNTLTTVNEVRTMNAGLF
jgi:hypothetical protein